jgi:hypothetical protein
MTGAHIRWSVVVLVSALLLAACGADGGELAADEQVGSDDTPASTVPLPPGGRQPTSDEPLSVLFAGDSIGLELAAPGIAALGGGGSAATYFVANPSITRDPVRNALWEQRLDESDPDVIVLLVGVWERMVFGRDQLDGQTVSEYRTDVIDPFVNLITGHGAEIVWVTSPLVADPVATSQIDFLNEAFRSLGASDDRVQFIDAADAVANPDGSFAEIMSAPGQAAERVRRIDGTHLCPGGAVRMAQLVIDEIVDRWNVPIVDDWQNGAWRDVEPFEAAPTECPAVG